ncbi:MAG TPA: sigma-70 family RNA polymerase sigma factor [Thermoanaerobaculia bacterium]|nr:sigma-70 family RNA polymerase sigma factor [Thermoanaerobaculia bacterium]
MQPESDRNGFEARGREALEDELLVTRCQIGEASAFDELIGRWHTPLWKYARRVTGNDDAAAETVQEVWLRILRGIVRLREPGRFRPWMFGIARRVMMDRLRSAYAAPVVESIDLSTIPEPQDSRDLELEISNLHEELARLPVIEREVLVLFYLQELTLNEIADVLAIPAGTVKSRLFRARHLLREQLTTKGTKR